MKGSLETLDLTIENHIATLAINRPQARNALNRLAYTELEQTFIALQNNQDVRCIILTGTDPAFCSGDDVKELMTGDASASHSRLRAVRPTMTPAAAAILACDRPIIAAVNGAAVGWGMDLSLLADFRIASERARFGELFVKRGSCRMWVVCVVCQKLSVLKKQQNYSSPANSLMVKRPLIWGLQ